MKKCVIIYNEKSGKVKSSELIDYFYNITRENGYDLEVICTKRKGHATSIIKELPDDVDLVISAGGDGTFNECIKGNIERKNKLVMGNLPLGTTNDVGNMYGLGHDYKQNLISILNGVKKNIDIILINGHPFIYVAAFGNFINVTYDTPKKLKEKFGRLAYVLFGITEFNEKIRMNHIKYTIDGKTHEGEYSYIFITNSNRIGGVNDIYHDIKLDDNKFEVLLCSIKNKADIAKSLYHVINNGVTPDLPGCEYYSTSNFYLEFDKIPSYSWGLDGEEFKPKTKNFKFSVNKEVYIMLPRKNINKLFVNKEE